MLRQARDGGSQMDDRVDGLDGLGDSVDLQDASLDDRPTGPDRRDLALLLAVLGS